MLACNAKRTKFTARNVDFVNGRGETLCQRLARSTTVDPITGCHLWTDFRDPNGYGRVQWNGNKSALVHRLSMEAAGIELRPEDDALHNCDTPGCHNPDHQRVGTHQENMRDRTVRFRNGALKFDPITVECLRVTAATEVFTQRQLAKWFGMSEMTVSNIIRRKRWGHV